MDEPYYLLNFRCVLEDVRSRYGDLLLPEELERVAAFLDLPRPAQCLYVRMLTRRGPWFRLDGLAYPEVPDPAGTLAALYAAGFCAGPERAAPGELAALLRKEELVALLREAGLPCRSAETRRALEERLLAEAPEAIALEAFAPEGTGWVRLLFLLFFGNGEQDLTDFVLGDLGHVRYEDYEVDPRCRLFQSREEVDVLMALDGLRDALAAGGDLEGLTRTLLAMERFPGLRAQRRYHRLLAEAGRAWERGGAHAQALACYARSEVPPARERTVRILTAEGRPEEAAALALEMAAGPRDVGEERAARRLLTRLAAKDPRAARWVAEHPPAGPAPSIRLKVPRHPSGSVEQAALAAAEGWTGFHTENVLWNALYGLAFWDVLFAPVPGAFQHRFQWAPADLRTPRFLERRQEAIAQRLRDLEAPGGPRRLILATAERKRGLANAFVHWRGLPQAHLEAALDTLPQAALLEVLRIMAPDPSAFRSGFPDLFLHREGRCMLWEVKGPGDALRPEQERWLAILNRVGLEARVAWVTYEDPAPQI